MRYCEEYTNSQLRKMRGVYCLTFPNGKRYVGYTTADSSNFAHRWTCHLKDANKGSKNAVHNAIRKYGWKNVKKEVILISEDEERCKSLEKQLIAFWKLNCNRFKDAKGYNLTDGGDGCQGPNGHIAWNKGMKGVFSHTDESKKLISERSKELWQEEWYKKRIIENTKNYHKNNPEHAKMLAENGRKRFTKYITRLYLQSGEIREVVLSREYERQNPKHIRKNIEQMLNGKRKRVADIVKVERILKDES